MVTHSTTPPRSDALTGTRLGQYQVSTRLYEGGMGYVYTGVHVHLKRQVAIKIARRDVPNHAFLQKQLISEAQYLAMVDHVNVVTVHDLGILSGELAYLVMELLDGLSLDKIIDQRGPLKIPTAIHVIREVARGLAAFHEKEVVCADVKPDNVMVVSGPLVGRALNRRSWIKLIDLGAARKIERILDPRRAPEPVMGTSWYMSPEAVLGMDLDERADIYSLGVLLFESIVGRVPFLAAQDEEIFRMHLWTPAPRLSSMASEAEPNSALDRLVSACLEKAPGARPSSMYEFLDLLDQADTEWRAAHPPRPESEDPTQHIPPLRPGRSQREENDHA